MNGGVAHQPPPGVMDRLIAFCIDNPFVVVLGLLGILVAGLVTAPFAWHTDLVPRFPVPVDAIPDIGDNQQIVFTEWSGRSPRDVEDQVTYPLTSLLLGLAGVKTVRSQSMFGFSSIFIIFDDGVDYYWSRTRVLERLASLPPGTLPEGVRPILGPDATPLGQVFWYTLEGRSPAGTPTGGWDPQELRTIQDWQIRQELMSVPGVAEVASVGGFVVEYQVDVDPSALRAFDVSLGDVAAAVRSANLDVGASTIEVNGVEYLLRGVGFARETVDLADAVVRSKLGKPVLVRDVARVSLGPASRRGALDKGGVEAVGGVVVVRFGANPLAVIEAVKERVRALAPSLPSRRIQRQKADGTTEEVVSRVTVIPFYDRTGLIEETLATLKEALTGEILVTVLVVILMLWHFSSSLLVSSLLPFAVALAFVAMKIFGVDANVVALSGIAIAIGTMVDMGIVLDENILTHLEARAPGQPARDAVLHATTEVAGAVTTAVATTVVGFLPVFALQGSEGKLFGPLAWTKTFALCSSLFVAIFVIPPMAALLFRGPARTGAQPSRMRRGLGIALHVIVIVAVVALLSEYWLPLGVEPGFARNAIAVAGAVGCLVGFFQLFRHFYVPILRWCLAHKPLFLALPTTLCITGAAIWLGFDSVAAPLPRLVSMLGGDEATVRGTVAWTAMSHAFPGMGKEFMPPLDEGSYLLMPTLMPHASMGECLDVLRTQDRAIDGIPEVVGAVGKIGRVDSPLDPAPLSMIETVIAYRPEYLLDESGRRRTFAYLADETDLVRGETGEPLSAPDGQPYRIRGRFLRQEGALVESPSGRPFRLWRRALDPALNPGRPSWPGIRSPDDIWDEIVRVSAVTGTTSAPRLQPIAARLVMLQSGMRAPMGVRIRGRGDVSLDILESVGLLIEGLLRGVDVVQPGTVAAEHIVGKPYLEFVVDREAAARHGVTLRQVQDTIEAAAGGRKVTTIYRGRNRFAARIRYPRELRDSPEALEALVVPAPDGAQIPVRQLLVGGRLTGHRGPMVIKGENGSLISYVLFDKRPQVAEVDAVEQCRAHLDQALARGDLVLPPGVSFEFAGTFESQVRSERRLRLVLPTALFAIFLILYVQFRRISTTLFVFSGIAVAMAGGFVMLWLYGTTWFMDVNLFGVGLRSLFGMGTINLSVAVWVGFVALFGIATDDGVVMATYLDQRMDADRPSTVDEVRDTVVAGASRRVRPCLMTTATTLLALLPVLTSTGKGSDIMVPMSIPTFGGMTFEVMTMLVLPVLYAAARERAVLRGDARPES